MGLDDPENLRLEALLGLVLIFFTAFTVADKMPSTATYSGLVAFLGAISWISVPYLIYRDVEELPDIGWQPNKWFYSVVSFIPYINVGFTLLYVFKRQRINECVKKGRRNLFRSEWWKAVIGFAGLFIIGSTIFSIASANSSNLTLLGDIGMILFTSGWVGIPMAMSFDRTFLRSSYGIEFGSRMTKIAVIPFIGVAAALLYFIERHSKVSRQKQRKQNQNAAFRGNSYR